MTPAPPWKPGDPLVSVVTVTYQHVPFIRKCVESVLEQRTAFPIEHLIGEDDSADGTRELCKALADAHPERIRLFLRDRSDVLHIMGRPTGRANVVGLYHEARGKYIAVLPGDDHWCDPEKLQRQVEAMEADPSLAGCFTDAWNERDGDRSDYLESWDIPRDRQRFVAADLVRANFVPSATFLFRRDLLFPLPPQFMSAPIGDWMLVLHMAGQGGLLLLDGHTAVRTVHQGGIISAKGLEHKVDVNLAMLKVVGEVFDRPWGAASVRRAMLAEQAWERAVAKGDRERARQMLSEYKATHDRVPLRSTLRMWLITHHPRLARLIHRYRGG